MCANLKLKLSSPNDCKILEAACGSTSNRLIQIDYTSLFHNQTFNFKNNIKTAVEILCKEMLACQIQHSAYHYLNTWPHSLLFENHSYHFVEGDGLLRPCAQRSVLLYAPQTNQSNQY